MPHLVLEYSANIIEKDNLQTLLKASHEWLANTLPTDINGCKSRAIEHTTYYIGNGDVNNAFVHVNLKVMPGRNFETLQKVGNKLMEMLSEHFAQSAKKLNLQLTLEIEELAKNYFKRV